MGEEFAVNSPFLYFTSHNDPELARAVSEGRRREFADFASGCEFHDPQSPETFEKSKIDWSQSSNKGVLDLYRNLILLRKRTPCLSNCHKDLIRVDVNGAAPWLKLERSVPGRSS